MNCEHFCVCQIIIADLLQCWNRLSLYKCIDEPEVLSWSLQLDEAFTSLKNSISDNQVLPAPNTFKKITLCINASGVDMGAVLNQEDYSGLEPVAYYSRGLTKAERNYSTSELECLVVVEAVQLYTYFLESSPFKVTKTRKVFIFRQNEKRLTRC